MQLILRIVLAVVAVVSLAMNASAQERQLYMLDFVFLNEGITLADRDAYNRVASGIASRHGIEHVATFDPVRITDGPQDLARVDLWTLPSREALAEWGEDADFKALAPRINEVHDLENLTVYFADEILPLKVIPGGFYHLELFTFSEAIEFDRFVDYVNSVDAIGADHGIHRSASFGNLARVIGQGPNANWLNLYRVPGPEQYNAMGNDPRMTALRDVRNTLFVQDGSLLGAFVAR